MEINLAQEFYEHYSEYMYWKVGVDEPQERWNLLEENEQQVWLLIAARIVEKIKMENQQLGDLAQIAYEVYAEHQNWKNYAGQPIPTWDQVRSDIKQAWIASITAVLDLAKLR